MVLFKKSFYFVFAKLKVMKTIVFVIFFFIICLPGCKSTQPAAGVNTQKNQQVNQNSGVNSKPVNFSDPETWILGYFKVDRLYRPPYSTWFVKGFDEYSLNSEVIGKLKSLINPGISIKIVLGTWCPDSRREVPRFMRIVDAISFPPDKIELLGVDNSKNAPIDNYSALDIQRVPTFIIYKNNIEAGRIIENPVTSLEQDMVNILSRNE